MLITMNVNGKKVDIDVSYDEYLVDTLRRIGNLSVKRGCDTGCCGLCSIWIDGLFVKENGQLRTKNPAEIRHLAH